MNTPRSIIEDTIRYYESHPFGYVADEEECVYLLGDRRCAIGRYLVGKVPDEELMARNDAPVTDLSSKWMALLPHGHGLTRSFWRSLQKSHDGIAKEMTEGEDVDIRAAFEQRLAEYFD